MTPTSLRALIAARRTLLTASLIVATSCGGSGDPTGNGGGANFHATIDGVPWQAAALGTAVQGAAGGIFTIVGGTLSASIPALSFTLYNISGPGTYKLGVGGTVPGGSANITLGSTSWSTPLTGLAGEVIITDVSATHIAGSFEFDATPLLGGGATRMVENGTFDLPVHSTGSVAVPAYSGNTFTGTLGGAPWNAATIVTVSAPSSGTLTLGASNNGRNINLIISGYTGAVPYSLNTGVQRQITVMTVGAPLYTWGGAAGLSTGTVNITSATATRIQGHIDASLQPGAVLPGPGTIALVADFSLGIAP